MADDAQPVAPYTGTVPLVMALAAVAGFLDAVSLARITHTFVAFQTGNIVLVGVSVGRGHWSDAAEPAVAVIAFVLGSALVQVMIGGREPARTRAWVVARLLAVACGLLLVELIVLAAVEGLGGDPPDRGLRYVCIVLSGAAMAFQTPTVRRVAGVGVSSTFSTGMLTRLGQAIGALRVGAQRSRETVVVRVLGGTVLSFLVGAVLGGALLEPLGNAALVVPCVGLGVVTVFVARARPATVARRDG